MTFSTAIYATDEKRFTIRKMLVDFSYQIHFELCSLIFLVVISLQYFFVRRFPTFSNRMFGVVLILAIADLGLDILGCVTIKYINEVPVWTNYLVNGLFYFIETILPMFMCIYLIYYSGMTFVRNPRSKFIIVPSLLMSLIHFSNPFTGLIFSINMTGNGLAFVTGPFYYSIYVALGINSLIMLGLVFILRAKLSFKQILTVLFFIVIVSVTSAIQIKVPSLLLSGTATALSLILWDLTILSPETMTDETTSAYNDTALHLYLDSKMRKHHIYAAVISIDGLSNIEQGYGNLASTALEKQIGYYFAGLLMGKSAFYFRQSGSCFWLIFKNQMELEDASLKIVDKFKTGWKAQGIKVDLMAKILCVITTTNIQISSAELISIVNDTINSENVLNNQRIRLSVDSKLIAKYRRIQLIEESMRRAVKTKEGLYVCFQPIINLEHPEMNTAEVLLRYNDKNLGNILPSEFIPIVENRGLALFIDSFVVDAGCRFLARHPEVDMLHINLSATEFFHNPVQRITAIVNDHNVDPRRICFEITESSAAKNPEILQTFMKSMISRGFSFALDDYGTGYSNALQVMSMPFSFVKIPSMISTRQDKSRKFIDGTIRLFMDLGISTVVEGIETKEQLEDVTSLGVRYIQGFLFSQPLEEDDYLAYIKGGKAIG